MPTKGSTTMPYANRFTIRTLAGGWFAVVDATTDDIAKVTRYRAEANAILATMNANA